MFKYLLALCLVIPLHFQIFSAYFRTERNLSNAQKNDPLYQSLQADFILTTTSINQDEVASARLIKIFKEFHVHAWLATDNIIRGIASSFNSYLIEKAYISVPSFFELLNDNNQTALNIFNLLAHALKQSWTPVQYQEDLHKLAKRLKNDFYNSSNASLLNYSSGSDYASYHSDDSSEESDTVDFSMVVRRLDWFRQRALNIVRNYQTSMKDVDIVRALTDPSDELAYFFHEEIIQKRQISKDLFLRLFDEGNKDAQEIIKAIADILEGDTHRGMFLIRISTPADALYREINGFDYVPVVDSGKPAEQLLADAHSNVPQGTQKAQTKNSMNLHKADSQKKALNKESEPSFVSKKVSAVALLSAFGVVTYFAYKYYSKDTTSPQDKDINKK